MRDQSEDTFQQLKESPDWRIRDLEQRLAQRDRMYAQASKSLAHEIKRREQAQENLTIALGLESAGYLAAGMAHDLSNVLVALAMGYKVLRAHSLDDVVLDVSQNGLRATSQGQALIANLLSFMRSRVADPECISSSEWISERQDLLRYTAGRKLQFNVVVSPDAWPVFVSTHRLCGALINLVVNARHATPAGGAVHLEIYNLDKAQRPDFLAALSDGDFVVYAVTDTGVGMTPEVLAKATTPLFTTKPAGKGTGLGLHMVQMLAREAGGTLHITSTPGQGTRVEIFLPRYVESVSASQSAPAMPASPKTMALSYLAGQQIDRIIERLKTPAMLDVLLAWRAFRESVAIPNLVDIQRMACTDEVKPWSFIAQCDGDLDDPTFQFLHIGEQLSARAGDELSDAALGVTPASALGTLIGAYRRAQKSGSPSYESARFTLGNAPAAYFERLIVPASVDGRRVSHLLGVVSIANV